MVVEEVDFVLGFLWVLLLMVVFCGPVYTISLRSIAYFFSLVERR